MKQIRLILTFYKSFAFAGFVSTFICLGLLYGFGEDGIRMIKVFFWFKLFTVAVIIYSINNYKRSQFYYYKNLGLSKLKLWLATLTFDFLFFLISIIFLAIHIHEALPGS